MREHRKALVVGIDNYPGFPLENCVTDAVKIANLLEQHSNEEPNFEVKSLLSSTQTITKSILKQEIDRLFSGNPSISLLYFAGHGYVNSYGGYLVTPDFQRYDEGVSMDDIIKLANNSEANDKVIILDCCYSGRLAVPNSQQNKTSELCDGLTILTSCRENELAGENEGGIFSSLFIDALDGQCSDLTGNILPSSIYTYIDRAMGIWGGQRPIFKTSVSRFISLRKSDPPIATSILRKIVRHFSSPNDEHQLDPSYEFTHSAADDANVAIFKELQKLESVGLVVPVDEEHMYFAAINEKSCQLTTLGKQYWRLIKNKKI